MRVCFEQTCEVEKVFELRRTEVCDRDQVAVLGAAMDRRRDWRGAKFDGVGIMALGWQGQGIGDRAAVLEHGTREGQQLDTLTCMDSLVGFARNIGAGRNTLQAANVTAIAALAVPVNGHMSQLSRRAICSFQYFAIHNHAPTDASANG